MSRTGCGLKPGDLRVGLDTRGRFWGRVAETV